MKGAAPNDQRRDGAGARVRVPYPMLRPKHRAVEGRVVDGEKLPKEFVTLPGETYPSSALMYACSPQLRESWW